MFRLWRMETSISGVQFALILGKYILFALPRFFFLLYFLSFLNFISLPSFYLVAICLHCFLLLVSNIFIVKLTLVTFHESFLNNTTQIISLLASIWTHPLCLLHDISCTLDKSVFTESAYISLRVIYLL